MLDRLVSLRSALLAFVEAEAVQSQTHIRPLHRHIAERLVIEGGFRPDRPRLAGRMVVVECPSPRSTTILKRTQRGEFYE